MFMIAMVAVFARMEPGIEAPAPGLWVTYDALFATSAGHVRSTDPIWIQSGHGRSPSFSLRLSKRRSAGVVRAVVRAAPQLLDNCEPPARHRRRDVRTRLKLVDRAAAQLVRLIRLPLPSLASHERSRFDPEPAAASSTPFAWRSEQMRRYGREFLVTVDLRRDRKSAAARFCRSLKLERNLHEVGDGCVIKGVADRRDGWPIIVDVTRTQSDEKTYSSRTWLFQRLAPLKSHLAPPNPCPSATL